MDFTLQWGGGPEDPEDLLVTTSGAATVEGLSTWVQAALADAKWRPPMRVLVDNRLLDWRQVTAADVEQRADLLARNSDRIGHSYVAAITNGALDFGLMRMEEVQVEAKAQYELEVFHSIEDAREWLRTVTVEELRDTLSVPVG